MRYDCQRGKFMPKVNKIKVLLVVTDFKLVCVLIIPYIQKQLTWLKICRNFKYRFVKVVELQKEMCWYLSGIKGLINLTVSYFSWNVFCGIIRYYWCTSLTYATMLLAPVTERLPIKELEDVHCAWVVIMENNKSKISIQMSVGQ